jgi:hypothetical protein
MAEGFQRRRLKCEKVNGRQTSSDGKISLCLWQGELKNGGRNNAKSSSIYIVADRIL